MSNAPLGTIIHPTAVQIDPDAEPFPNGWQHSKDVDNADLKKLAGKKMLVDGTIVKRDRKHRNGSIQ